MRHEHDTRAQSAQEPLEALEAREVEIVGRLVEAEDIEAGEEDRRESRTCGLAARQVAHLSCRPSRQTDLGQRGRSARVEVAAAQGEEAVEGVAVRPGQLGLVPEPRTEGVDLVPRGPDPRTATEVRQHRLARPCFGLLWQVADRPRAHDLARIRLLDARE